MKAINVLLLCSTISRITPTVLSSDLRATIGIYPDYDGDLIVSGDVEITFDEYAMSFLFNGEGLGAGCGPGCGIHIHTGTTCSDADLVGGHYWAPADTDDPWMNDVTYYDSDSFGNAIGQFSIENGYLIEGNVDHAVVVHDSDGVRVGCGILLEPEKTSKAGKKSKKSQKKKSSNTQRVLTAVIGTYPDYDGDLAVAGDVEIIFDEYAIDFSFNGKGLEASCGPGCGVHIHTGTTCSDADLVGGHYWAPAGTEDPWINDVTYYDSDSSGNAIGQFSIENGYLIEGNVDHAVVVHDSDGVRVGCGILLEPEKTSKGSKKPKKSQKTKKTKSSTTQRVLTAVIGTYPDYDGDLIVSGGIEITFDEYVIDFRFNGKGLGAGCGPGCGVHIHTGITCSDADLVGGHYWAPADTEDPWMNDVTYYDSDSSGNAIGQFSIENGYLIEGNVGHAVVVHDSDGVRVGCGILG